MTAAQLPWHLHVTRLTQAQVVLVVGEHVAWPGKSRLEVAVPVDAPPERGRTRAEKIDHVLERLLGRGSRAPRVLRIGVGQGPRATASFHRIDKEALDACIERLLRRCPSQRAAQR